MTGWTADEVAGHFGMVPLPGEGGRWVQTLLDGRSSAILYLLADGEQLLYGPTHVRLVPGAARIYRKAE